MRDRSLRCLKTLYTSSERFVVIFQSYDYFSLRMSFFKVPQSLRNLTQWVTSIDNRDYFAGFKKLLSIACGGRGKGCPGRRTFSETPAAIRLVSYVVLGAIHE